MEIPALKKNNEVVDNLGNWWFNWLKNVIENNQKLLRILPHRKKLFLLCMYKMVDISAEAWNKAGISVIKVHENDDVNKTLLLLLCIYDIHKRLGGTNIYGLNDKEIKEKYKVKKISGRTKQQIRKYKISTAWLIKGSKNSMYVSEVIAIPVIMETRDNEIYIWFRVWSN